MLAGTIPAEDPEPQRDGLAACSRQQLADFKTSLQQKKIEATDKASWLTSRLKVAARDVLLVAATSIAEEYGRKVAELEPLHGLLVAADSILGHGQVVPGNFRQEKFAAPLVGKSVKRLPGDVYSGCHYCADFSSGSGVMGAADAWRAALRAASGQDLG